MALQPLAAKTRERKREEPAGGTMSTAREPQTVERTISDREFEELLLKTWEYMSSDDQQLRLADSPSEPPSLA
jgi:hypothetical protein